MERHVSERDIGYITASLTIGTLAGTLPASLLVRRFGLQRLMLLYVTFAPVCLALRTFSLATPAQIGLSVLAGLTISIWSVCFSPALAKLTTQGDRTFSFGLFVATGIGAGSLSGVLAGRLPRLANVIGHGLDGIQVGLWMASLLIGLAAFAVIRLRMAPDVIAPRDLGTVSSFLIRFLVVAAVWNFAMGFFTPFATVYLSRRLGLSFSDVAQIYTVAGIFQIAAVLLAPLLYRRAGLIPGIALTQMVTGIMLLCLSHMTGRMAAVGIYLLLCTLQYMGGPGIAALLMNNVPELNRSHAAGLQNIISLAAQAAATALAGRLFEQFDYARPLMLDASLAVIASGLFYCLLRPNIRVA